MQKLLQKLIAVMAPGLLCVSCSKNEAPPKDTANVMVKTTATLGKVLADSKGMTLYYFTRDTSDNSVCTGGCAATWPPFYVENLKADTSLVAADFATITRTDGAKQTTYKGWPLYYYKDDATSTDVKGENVNQIWFVAKSDYSIALMNNQLTGHNGKQYTSAYVEGQEVVQYFTDAYGRTLYSFKNDRFKKNNFTKEDFSNNAVWPVYETATLKSLPSALTASDFAIIDVFGKKQLTYKGWPLYYFGQDAQVKGKNKGISFPTPGIWPIVNQNAAVAPAQ
jgi:predicted lipoprotein with Yx(FWY)xxD motif